MDLLDFAAEGLYFDENASPQVTRLLEQAAEHYGTPQAEQALLRAFAQGPENLSVLVGLYRFYYYQHRYEEALEVAERAMRVVALRLGIREHWQDLDQDDLAQGALSSMTLLRFYLYALKGAAYLELRLGRAASARQRLQVIAAVDHADRIGVAPLIELADAAIAEADAPAAVNH